ncbi:helix-turn-helix transcriptional regulator [Chitinophaga sp. 22321]|uniref:Helix-turn-helix transcriptional regulator n=1 Tax=Chitinophaga hostae TaxID=2831022 RepID=A0ABS5J298_9BACT|nr:helix-turn-helix transcriptional regulator [Chitinophaga hostae]MBS0028697.1 helix-turn-helix transcriptional regulator [Chitinophaga hostae]
MKTSTINHWEKKIQLAISLSHNDPHGERDLRTVAAMISESVDNFSHKFVEIYGESYIHFTKRRRLEAGAGYLRHSDFSIGQISEMCGYTHSSFTKAFRELYNEAPVSFRDRLYLPNEEHTLARTKIATTPHDDPQRLIFSPDRTEEMRLPDYVLYYNILPRNNDPVRSMVEYMSIYQQQLHAIKASMLLPGAMIITGTLDVVPVTNYAKMMMYVGIMVPVLKVYDIAHLQIRLAFQDAFGLFTKNVPGGYYKKLPVPMSFVAAGLPMYEFINSSCRAGHFKMSGNHFFISLTGENECEIFIPWQKR